MGDRGNIKVYQNIGAVYLYTHWAGSDLPTVVHKSLSRRLRWDDAPYLTRMLFCELLSTCYPNNPGEALSQELGFGISTSLGDNTHPIVGVNTKTQKVTFETEHGTTVLSEFDFNEYIDNFDAIKHRPF